MKKLLVLATVVAVAAMSQAASFAWNVSGIKSSSDSSIAGANYLAVFMEGTDSTLSALTTALSAGDISGVDTTYSKLTSSAGLATSSGNGSLAAGDTLSGFVVIFDAATLDEAANYLVAVNGGASIVSKTVGTAGGNITLSFGSQASNTAWTSMAVPEPTSGLLMLLGMAGLALRRRRA